MFTATKQQWAVFEQWENEYLAESLAKLTPERALVRAGELYRLAVKLAPESMGRLPCTVDELLNSDDIQTALRMRRGLAQLPGASLNDTD